MGKINIKDLSHQDKVEIYQQLQQEFATARVDKKLDEVNQKKTDYQKLKNKLQNKFGYDVWREKLVLFSFYDNGFKVSADNYTFNSLEQFNHHNIILIDNSHLKEVERIVSDVEEFIGDKREEYDKIYSEIKKKREELFKQLKHYSGE